MKLTNDGRETKQILRCQQCHREMMPGLDHPFCYTCDPEGVKKARKARIDSASVPSTQVAT